MYLAQGSNLLPLLLGSFVLVILSFRVNIQVLLLPLEFLYYLNRDFNSFFVFVEKEGLYYKVNNMANIANLVLYGILKREALLQNSTELIITAMVIT